MQVAPGAVQSPSDGISLLLQAGPRLLRSLRAGWAGGNAGRGRSRAGTPRPVAAGGLPGVQPAEVASSVQISDKTAKHRQSQTLLVFWTPRKGDCQQEQSTGSPA